MQGRGGKTMRVLTVAEMKGLILRVERRLFEDREERKKKRLPLREAPGLSAEARRSVYKGA